MLGDHVHPIGRRLRRAALVLTFAYACPLTAAITVSPDFLGSATAGKPFSMTLTATGGVAPYTFRIVTGSLPLGLELKGSGVSGTPAISIYGVWDFGIEAQDATGATGTTDCYMRVAPADIALKTTSLPAGSVGASYSVKMAVDGGVGPRIFTLESGDLPPGLLLEPGVIGKGGFQSADNNVIKGTPTAKGIYSFVIGIADYFGRSATFPLSITIAAAGEVPLGVQPSSVPSGRPNELYPTVAFAGEGGAGNYTLAFAGSLPKGLAYANGAISGTPASDSGGTYTFSIEVRDGSGAVVSRPYSLTISSIQLLPASLEAGTAGKPYDSVTFTASGGKGAYSFALKGSLPAGLTFSSGTLSGTAESGSAGSYAFTIEVRDEGGGSLSQAYSLTIKPAQSSATVAPLTLFTPSLTAAVGGKMNFVLFASGGVPSYTFSVSAGKLPQGVTLSADGVLSGQPEEQGLFRITVTLQDSAGSPSASGTLYITVAERLAISSDSLPVLTQNSPYGAVIRVSGGVQPYTWVLTSGALPPGLTLNWLTGLISGTFTSAGYYRFTVQVSDATASIASRDFTLGFDGTPPSISIDGILPGAAYNRPYRTALQASSANQLIWTLESGALPDGLALLPTGELTGVTGALGTYVFTVRVTDPGRRSDSKEFSLTVHPPLTIRTIPPLPDAELGIASTTFRVAGGVGPFTWRVVSGALPPGFTLSAAGVLSGTTAARGTFAFTVAVTDSTDAQATVPFTIRVEPALVLSAASLPRLLSDVPYTARLEAAGGLPPYRWSGTGLPAGLSLDPATGLVSGSPSLVGQVQFEATVTDQRGTAVSRSFPMTVAPGPLAVTTTTLPDAVTGEPYSFKLSARGGTRPYYWNIVGSVATPSLRLAPDGTLSAPALDTRTYAFTVAVFDAESNFVRADLTLRASPSPLQLTAGTLPDAVAGLPFSATMSARGGTPPYGWSITTGLAPAGIRLTPDGGLAGVTSEVGTHSFVVTVIDALSNVVSADVKLRVLRAPPATVRLDESLVRRGRI